MLRLLLVVSFLWSLSGLASASCELNMVYKEGEKLPLIEKKPSDAGLYQDLFQAAAARIGCKLVIQRYPKKRLHLMLSEGKLDFYPGASFSEDRAEYLYYVPNGLETGEYGVTNASAESINGFEELRNRDAVWLMEIGSSKTELAKTLGITAQTRSYLDIDLMRQFIERSPDKLYFYVADKELVDYYPKKTGYKSLKAAGLRVHKLCCGGEQPMYMGFSRFSPHYKDEKNPDYDPNKALSPDNFPVRIVKESVVYKLGEALKSLQKEGKTAELYRRWFPSEE